MLTLVNETKHAATLVRLVLDGHARTAVVIVKSTYDIDRGGEQLSRHQWPVFRGSRAMEGTTIEPETTLGKAGVDVVVLGDAAGDGRTGNGSIALGIGEWSSHALAFGDRFWRRARSRWRATAPQPFTQMPVTWATAFGGVAKFRGALLPHPSNPEGKGYIAELDAHGEGTALPNIEDPSDQLEQPGQLVCPLSFAPLPLSSALRVDTARDPSGPGGFSMAIYNVAHPRHRLAEIHGGERCEARGWVGMQAEVFGLPRERFVIEVRLGSQRYEYSPRIDSVLLLPRMRQLVVTRRAAFTYHYVCSHTPLARLRLRD